MGRRNLKGRAGITARGEHLKQLCQHTYGSRKPEKIKQKKKLICKFGDKFFQQQDVWILAEYNNRTTKEPELSREVELSTLKYAVMDLKVNLGVLGKN